MCIYIFIQILEFTNIHASVRSFNMYTLLQTTHLSESKVIFVVWGMCISSQARRRYPSPFATGQGT